MHVLYCFVVLVCFNNCLLVVVHVFWISDDMLLDLNHPSDRRRRHHFRPEWRANRRRTDETRSNNCPRRPCPATDFEQSLQCRNATVSHSIPRFQWPSASIKRAKSKNANNNPLQRFPSDVSFCCWQHVMLSHHHNFFQLCRHSICLYFFSSVPQIQSL